MELIQTLKATISGDDDRGVSPVIGVILMVAITVILAAVIATFVLGLGEQVSQTSPQVTIDWNESASVSGSQDLPRTVGATHNGGGSIEAGNIVMRTGNSSVADSAINNPTEIGYGSNSEITAGQLIGTVEGLSSGDGVRVVWQAPNGDTTATLGEYEVQG